MNRAMSHLAYTEVLQGVTQTGFGDKQVISKGEKKERKFTEEK